MSRPFAGGSVIAAAAESSAEVAQRVAVARARQTARYAALPEDRRVRTNAEADGTLLDEIAAPEPAGRALAARCRGADAAVGARLHRVLRVARTLADLDGAATVSRRHIAEALSYRPAASPSVAWLMAGRGIAKRGKVRTIRST